MKINFKAIGKVVCKYTKRFGPAAAIVSGAVATAYASYELAKAIPVAKQHIAEKKEELQKDKLTVKETVQACAKDIVKPVAIGSAGIAGIVGGVCGYEKTVTTLTNAVGVATSLINEQEKELVKAVGEQKANDIRNAAIENTAAAKNTNAYPFGKLGVAMTPYPEELFFEPFTGRWLMSSENWLKTCELAVCRKAMKSAFMEPIRLSNLYDTWIGTGTGSTESTMAEYIGWNLDRVEDANPMDITFKAERMDNGTLYKKIIYANPAEFIQP